VSSGESDGAASASLSGTRGEGSAARLGPGVTGLFSVDAELESGVASDSAAGDSAAGPLEPAGADSGVASASSVACGAEGEALESAVLSAAVRGWGTAASTDGSRSGLVARSKSIMAKAATIKPHFPAWRFSALPTKRMRGVTQIPPDPDD
jgi:hypothetical protein